MASGEPQPLLVSDTHGNLKYCNAAVAKILGDVQGILNVKSHFLDLSTGFASTCFADCKCSSISNAIELFASGWTVHLLFIDDQLHKTTQMCALYQAALMLVRSGVSNYVSLGFLHLLQ